MADLNDFFEDALEEGAKTAVGKTLARSGLGGWLFFLVGLFGAFCIGVAISELYFPLVLAGLVTWAFCFFIAGLMLQPSKEPFRTWMIVAVVVLVIGILVGFSA